MITLLLLISLLQDGPVATAPVDAGGDLAARDAGPALPAYPPLRSAEDCRLAANRGLGEAEFDCAVRFNSEQRSGRRYGRLGGRADTSGEVPGWALNDPAGWEASQCGTTGDDACRRQARNRLAMARAGVVAEAPADNGGAPRETCRMVMQRSESGFGGSLSRVCSTGPEAEAALTPLNEMLRPRAEPCDRPASLETQEAWIARCRALPAD